MKAGDKIIYDSGYYSKDKGVMYGTVEVHLLTGIAHGKISCSRNEVLPFNQENYEKMINTYGRNKWLPENFEKEIIRKA